jgi:RNA polymerase sigma-54 factor
LDQYARKRSIEGEMAEVIQHVKERIERAERFIELLRQREETLLRTAREIVLHQRLFFLKGCDEKLLRPLILQDIADAVKLDVSTISRVVNSKYIATPCGIFPLKYFFSEGLRTREGKRISNKAIKRMLQELIAQEDPSAPYSDERLMELLREKGIEIKRRTVAKYREQLGIPPARARRRLPPA